MSKIKNYDLALYPSVSSGVYDFIKSGRINGYGFAIYSKKALSDVLTFLCVNNIHHSYTITPLGADFNRSGINSVITLSWESDTGMDSFTFWSTIEVDENE